MSVHFRSEDLHVLCVHIFLGIHLNLYMRFFFSESGFIILYFNWETDQIPPPPEQIPPPHRNEIPSVFAV